MFAIWPPVTKPRDAAGQAEQLGEPAAGDSSATAAAARDDREPHSGPRRSPASRPRPRPEARRRRRSRSSVRSASRRALVPRRRSASESPPASSLPCRAEARRARRGARRTTPSAPTRRTPSDYVELRRVIGRLAEESVLFSEAHDVRSEPGDRGRRFQDRGRGRSTSSCSSPSSRPRYASPPYPCHRAARASACRPLHARDRRLRGASSSPKRTST